MSRYTVALLPTVLLICCLCLAAPPAHGQDANPGQADQEAEDQGKASPGQADLDKATELKINAKSLNEINQVIGLLDAALDKGLDDGNAGFAKSMLVGSLMQRAGAYSSRVLNRSPVEGRRDPQWLQFRTMAMNDLRRVVGLDKTQTDAFLLLGRLHTAPQPLGDPAAAREALTQVIEAEDVQPKKRAQAYLLRSITRSSRDARIADLTSAIELEPEKAEYLVLRARELQGAEQFDKALEDANRAIELAPENASVHQLRALVLMSQDKFEEALQSFDKAAELKPDDLSTYQLRSELFNRMGDPDRALEQIDKAIALRPEVVSIRLLRVNILIKAERFEDALADIDEMLAKQPDFREGQLIRSQLLGQLGRDDEALAELEKLAEALPKEPQVQLQLAAHYMDSQQPSKAIECLTKVLEVASDNTMALRLRGDMYLSIGKHAEALEDFRRAYAQQSDDSGLLNNFAWTLATSPFDELRDGDRAVELAKRACELTDYQQPHIISTLAAAYAEVGDFEAAIDWSQQAVDLTREGIEEELTDELEKELASYQAGKPWRELQQQLDAEPLEGEDPIEEAQLDKPPARSIDF